MLFGVPAGGVVAARWVRALGKVDRYAVAPDE